MFVCLCKRITDTQIRTAVQDGASSIGELRSVLGVASQCGKCESLTGEIMQETLLDTLHQEQLFYAVS